MIGQLRRRLVARTLHDLDEVRQEDRHADRRNERREPEGASERPVGEPLDGPVPQAGQRHRCDQHHDERDRKRAQMKDLGENHEDDQGDEGRQHEQVAMGEIDHADDAVDHRVADRDQTVDRSERQPVDELLEEIVHTRPSLRFSPGISQETCQPRPGRVRMNRAANIALIASQSGVQAARVRPETQKRADPVSAAAGGPLHYILTYISNRTGSADRIADIFEKDDPPHSMDMDFGAGDRVRNRSYTFAPSGSPRRRDQKL